MLWQKLTPEAQPDINNEIGVDKHVKPKHELVHICIVIEADAVCETATRRER